MPGVDAVAQVGVGLIGRAEVDGLRLGQRAVQRRAGGGAGQHADLELAPGVVFGGGACGDRQRNRFRRAGRGESAETDGLPVLDQSGSFVCRKNGK